MKKIITALASAACLLCAATAQAGLYKYEFTATNFFADINTGEPAPQPAINGWITFTSESFGAPVTSITGIDLTIAGHKYTADEIGASPYRDAYMFGGTIAGLNGVRTGVNDFILLNNLMGFSVAGPSRYWYGGVTSSYTELYAEVPEPSSLALLLAGAGGLGALLRRRRRQA